MAVDTTALKQLAGRIKRQTTNRDILELCDGILAMAEPSKTCMACEARRRAKTESQRRWRQGRQA